MAKPSSVPAAPPPPRLAPHQIYEISFKAALSPPTIRKYLHGQTIQPSGRVRLEIALRELGHGDLVRR